MIKFLAKNLKVVVPVALLALLLVFGIGSPKSLELEKQKLINLLFSSTPNSYDIEQLSASLDKPLQIKLDRDSSELLLFTFPLKDDFSTQGLPADVDPFIFLNQDSTVRIVFKDKDNEYQSLENSLKNNETNNNIKYEFKNDPEGLAKTLLELSNSTNQNYLVAVSLNKTNDTVTKDSLHGQLAYLEQNFNASNLDAYPVIKFFLINSVSETTNAISPQEVNNESSPAQQLQRQSTTTATTTSQTHEQITVQLSKELSEVSRLQQKSFTALTTAGSELNSFSNRAQSSNAERKKAEKRVVKSYKNLSTSFRNLKKYIEKKKNRKKIEPILGTNYFDLVRTASSVSSLLAKQKKPNIPDANVQRSSEVTISAVSTDASILRSLELTATALVTTFASATAPASRTLCVFDFQCTPLYCAGPIIGCVECTRDIHCKDPKKPACSVGDCTECNVDSQCKDPKKPACRVRGGCVECNVDSQCKDPNKPACRVGDCVECNVDSECKDPKKPACRVADCVECNVDSECKDPNKPACSIGTCRECTRGKHCKEPKPACDILSDTCKECIDDSYCRNPKPGCDILSRTCKECTRDIHCKEPKPACDILSDTCKECGRDIHCKEPKPVCDILSDTCKESTTTPTTTPSSTVPPTTTSTTATTTPTTITTTSTTATTTPTTIMPTTTSTTATTTPTTITTTSTTATTTPTPPTPTPTVSAI